MTLPRLLVPWWTTQRSGACGCWRTASAGARVVQIVVAVGGCVAPAKDTPASDGGSVAETGPLLPDARPADGRGEDTGHTGDTEETGDTQDTSDSAETADTSPEDGHAGWARIDLNYAIACATSAKGSVRCWDVWNDARYEPLEFTHRYSMTVPGVEAACALVLSGEVECKFVEIDWYDFYGISSPPEGTFVRIDGDEDSICGTRDDGSLACWGDIVGDELEQTEGSFTDVELGPHGGVAVTTDGQVRAWSRDTRFSLDPVPGGRTWARATLGVDHACLLDDAGLSFCWSWDDEGAGVIAPEGVVLRDVSANQGATCGVTEGGTISCWLAPGTGGDDVFRLVEDAPPGEAWVSVRVGKALACALDSFGDITCWGTGTEAMEPIPDNPDR